MFTSSIDPNASKRTISVFLFCVAVFFVTSSPILAADGFYKEDESMYDVEAYVAFVKTTPTQEARNEKIGEFLEQKYKRATHWREGYDKHGSWHRYDKASMDAYREESRVALQKWRLENTSNSESKNQIAMEILDAYEEQVFASRVVAEHAHNTGQAGLLLQDRILLDQARLERLDFSLMFPSTSMNRNERIKHCLEAELTRAKNLFKKIKLC